MPGKHLADENISKTKKGGHDIKTTESGFNNLSGYYS
jgi:hypothetical protein